MHLQHGSQPLSEYSPEFRQSAIYSSLSIGSRSPLLFLKKAAEAEAEAATEEGAAAASNYSSDSAAPAADSPSSTGGTLASDEQLAALREKLSGGA